ncbi:hypothetical protein ACFLZ7_03195 [Nanoarchaeota archaeon]
MDKSIIDYVKRQLERGFSHSEIKNALLKRGHKREHVKTALKGVHVKHPHLKPSKTLKRTFYGILVIAVIILAIIYAPKVSEIRLPVSTAACDAISNANERDICLLKLAAEKDRVDVCSGISTEPSDIIYFACIGEAWKNQECTYEQLVYGEGSEDECYMRLAASNRDISYCRYLEDELMKQCADQIIQIAISERNPSLCGEDVPTFMCRTALAIAFEDPSVCAEINEGNQSFCYLPLATRTMDESICKDIISQDLKKTCIKMTNYEWINKMAAISNSTDADDQIEYNLYAAYDNSDPQFCKSLQGWNYDSGAESLCYLIIASKTKNSETCDLISDTNWKQTCYAIVDKNLGKCNDVSTTDFSIMCEAWSTSTQKKCNNIKDVSEELKGSDRDLNSRCNSYFDYFGLS